MTRFDPAIHRRRSIRLQGYDYSQAGAYFVTICAHERQSLFGEIADGAMRMNDFGRIVMAEWLRSIEIRQEIEMGECVVMPNHFHGIVVIKEDAGRRGDRPVAPTITGRPVAPATTVRPVAPAGPQSKSIGALMAGFKSAVTKRINEMRNTPRFPVWQRNYYDHVIRDDADYNRIAEYIVSNPQRWIEDKLHPHNYRKVAATAVR
jgi:REP element-mobilizing transposase RayT